MAKDVFGWYQHNQLRLVVKLKNSGGSVPEDLHGPPARLIILVPASIVSIHRIIIIELGKVSTEYKR